MTANGSTRGAAALFSEAAKARVAALPTGTVTLEIDGTEVTVPEHYTIWDAAREQGIAVPVLCHDRRLEPAGVCRMCVVEVEGARTLQASCIRACESGMKVRTDSPAVQRNRKVLTELMMSDQRENSTRDAETGDDAHVPPTCPPPSSPWTIRPASCVTAASAPATTSSPTS